MSSSAIPFEIIETVIDILGQDKDLAPVKACSLVCWAFLPLCRKHIFSTVVLNDYQRSPTSRSFVQLICTTPEITDYIRNMTYCIAIDDFANPSIQKSIKRITRLRSLFIYGASIQWNNNPLRPTLLHLLHLPSLIEFKVDIVDNFMASDLAPCVGLKTLDIRCLTILESNDSFPTTFPDGPIQLKSLSTGVRSAAAAQTISNMRRPDGQLLINFTGLSSIKVTTGSRDEYKNIQQLFMNCNQLTNVYICVFDAILNLTGLSKMLEPSMETLTHLHFELYIHEADDPLCGVPYELQQMNPDNVVETITIGVCIRSAADCKRGEEWGRLEKVLMTSGWSALKRVSLAIEIRYDISGLQDALEKLPTTQFPVLSKSKSVAFEFGVTNAAF